MQGDFELQELFIGQELELEISRLAGLGDGIAIVGDRKLFVAKSAPGDRLRARVVQLSKNEARAEIISVLAPGADRVAPACKHFEQCGGCSLQQLSVVPYQSFKRGMAGEAIRKAGYDPELLREMLFIPPATRRRTTLAWDGEHLGYREARSHRIVAISECPVLVPALENMILLLREALLPLKRSIDSVHLTALDHGVDMLLSGTAPLTIEQQALAKKIGKSLSVVRLSHQCGDAIALLDQSQPAVLNISGISMEIPPGIFLQASDASQAALTDAVIQNVIPAPSTVIPAQAGIQNKIVDLYCGIGTYSIPLAMKGCEVTAIEGDARMTHALRDTATMHGLSLHAKMRDLVKHPFAPEELNRFDAVVINPPRVGAKIQSEKLAQSKMKKIVMVSCNPATFTRDAAILKAGGYALEYAIAVDQFVWSSHLELVAVFVR